MYEIIFCDVKPEAFADKLTPIGFLYSAFCNLFHERILLIANDSAIVFLPNCLKFKRKYVPYCSHKGAWRQSHFKRKLRKRYNNIVHVRVSKGF